MDSETEDGYTKYPKGKSIHGCFGFPGGTHIELLVPCPYNPDFMLCRWPDGREMLLESQDYEVIPETLLEYRKMMAQYGQSAFFDP